ncbi:ParB/RepB/Spo0J family partition protein [Rhizomicrobium electricum]|uniref:ParB/RepB/Spo0J family partition protein n=1 Tax=Rhizomicrobium electricum TaxID=480070 RepID=A0ABP3Q7H7_9PROT|nr:ParB/RepB/Spo0J family partition protein [Rhizomicrobium electricum]NIJ49235.1 ParB family chromosome partitioning protein [Rhizomicrobium electricum]
MAEDVRPRGLGRGLSALIGEDAPRSGNRAPRQVPTAFLRPNKFQPRKTFVDDDLNDLITSVKDKGILQPLLVRPIAGEPNAYEIVAGERRWRAAQAAKLHEVPVIVRELTDGQALEFAIIENVQRSDLNAIEEGLAYQELMDRFSYTQDQMADAVGKSRPHIANTIRLLKLPESVRVLVRDGKLAPSAARTLIGDPDAEARALEIVAGGLNVRQAEQRSKEKKPGKKAAAKPAAEDPNIKELEVSLANILGLKVQIVDKGEAGEVRILYKTLEQLDDLILRLKKY